MIKALKLHSLKTLFLGFAIFFSISAFAKGDSSSKEGGSEPFDAKEMIMHHVKDAYGFHLFDYDGHAVSIPLPIILWTDNGLTIFSSSKFHHDSEGKVIVEENEGKFINLHEKIYQLDSGVTTVSFDKEGHATNAHKPIDISITRNVLMLFVSAFILILLFIGAARRYNKEDGYVPRGLAGFLEPLVLFVRDEVAIPMIGEKKYKRFMPYLLTVFFFIWLNNIFGLIPFFNGANLSGNIAFTMTLAVITFIITTFSGNANYWKHIFWMPGVPIPMKIFLAPIEIIGMFVKPVSLMIRLFANITAGHIIVLALMSLIFIFKSVAVAPVSVAFSLFIGVIEIIVTAIQAYIFTVLSALYFGMATEEEHH